MTIRRVKPDPELEGKPLPFPEGTYDKGRSILNMLRSTGEIQNPKNFMNMALNWGFGGLYDYLYEFHDKVTQRKFLHGLLYVDDYKYGFNCPESLSELIANGKQFKINLLNDNILSFEEFYKDEFIESGKIDLKSLNNNFINQNKINNVKIVFVDDEAYLVISFDSKFELNPNFTGKPDGYTSEGEAYNFIDYPEGFDYKGRPYILIDFNDYEIDQAPTPDGYDKEGRPYILTEFTGFPSDFNPDGFGFDDRPYMLIPNFEKEYDEITINPIYFEISSLESYYKTFPENYPLEPLLDENGNCILDEESYRITTKVLDEYGKEYDVPRLENESNNDYLHRLIAYTQDVSSICGFRKYAAELLKITEDEIETEFIFTRFKTFETTLRHGETDVKKSSFAINRIKSDNQDGQIDEDTDIAVARDSPEVTNQLVLKMTIPCAFDLKWVYNNLVELLPIGLLFEVWDKCGNHYPAIFNLDLLMCTNLHLLANHKFLLNGEEHETNDQSKYISLDNEGEYYAFNVPGYHMPNTSLRSETGYFGYTEYFSRDIEGVIMVNPRESFIIQLLMKTIKKNEYMFNEI